MTRRAQQPAVLHDGSGGARAEVVDGVCSMHVMYMYRYEAQEGELGAGFPTPSVDIVKQGIQLVGFQAEWRHRSTVAACSATGT